MANPRKTLRKYRKLFNKLGVNEGTIKIVIVNRGQSVFGPSDANVPLSLGKPILNDEEDRRTLGITEFDTQVVRMWGGALEESGLYEVTRDALNRAMLPGGGILINDRHHALVHYEAGFAVGETVMQWFLVVVGRRQTRA